MIARLSIAEQYKEIFLAKVAMRPTLSQKMFVWGMLCMKIGWWFSEAEVIYALPQIFKYLFICFALFAVLYMLYQRPLSIKYYGVMGILVAVFSVYSFWLVFQTVQPTTRYLQFFFASKYWVLSFLLPVFVLFTKFDMKFISYMMRFSLKFLPALYLVLVTVLVSINQDQWSEHLWRLHAFNFALPFVLLNIHYLNGYSREKNLLIIFYLCLIAVGAIYGRRLYVIDMILLFIFYYILLSFNRVVAASKKMRNYFKLGLVIFVVMLMLGTLKNNLYIFERGLNSEGWDQSRSGVVNEYFADFGSRAGDWFWGRGLDGRILRSMDVEGGGYGDIIEIGYLFVLFKAGGFYLIMMVAILLTAAFRGWFKSRNQLSKSASVLIVIHLVGMVSFNLPVFNAEYALVWICVVICMSREIGRLTDREVKLLLNL